MVAGANAQALRIAPSLEGSPPPTSVQLSEAKLVLLRAIACWVDSAAGAAQQQSAGPHSVGTDTRAVGYRLWPTEVSQLQDIVNGPRPRRAFVIDRYPSGCPAASSTLAATSSSCAPTAAHAPAGWTAGPSQLDLD